MDIKNIIIAVSAALLIAAFLHYKRRLLVPFTLALCVALIWTSYYRYEYIGDNTFLLNYINLYPLALWAVGLTMLSIAYNHFRKPHRFFILTVTYLAALGMLELIGYHILQIRLNSSFTSLLNLGVIHAPPVMKVFYVVAGPIYLAVLHMLLQRVKPAKLR